MLTSPRRRYSALVFGFPPSHAAARGRTLDRRLAAPWTLRLADLAQDLRGVFAEPRGGALGRHRLAVDHDRRPHARDLTALGGFARRIDLHSALDYLRVGENLIEPVDRTGRHADRFQLFKQLVARHPRRQRT